MKPKYKELIKATVIMSWLASIVILNGMYIGSSFVISYTIVSTTLAFFVYVFGSQKRVDNAPAKALTEPKTQEQKTVQEIINAKLTGGAIEKALDHKFDDMMKSVADDLFSGYGDVTRAIKKKLSERMTPYVENYDFGEHAVKIEHLLNNLMKNLTHNEDRLIQNMNVLFGTEPVKTLKTSELFKKYTDYLADNIDTSKLEVDLDDGPHYNDLIACLRTESTDHLSGSTERKELTFTCEQDDDARIVIVLRRWTDMMDKAWHIERIQHGDSEWETTRNKSDLTMLDTPMNNLRDLNSLDTFLLKLYYDRTELVIDQEDITDEDIEVSAEPEADFN